MSKVGFSVIIACSHSEDSLKATMCALRELDYPQILEVIVIDDGTREGREAVARGAAGEGLPVRYLSLSGFSRGAAWNIAVRESSGDYMGFLDDDCLPPPGWMNAFRTAFDEWTVGVVGGPDRAPADASLFQRCLEYVLTSFIGTLGMRTGLSRVARYYPRPWNMAASKESLRCAGGFDEDSPEAPEVSMIRRLERIGYSAAYQPEALVWHRRETSLAGFISRDFRLGMERGRGISQPGIGKVYAAASVLLVALLALAVTPRFHDFSLYLLIPVVSVYALALALSGLHATILTRTPAAAIFVPFLLATHHAAHVAGYTIGRLLVRHRRGD